MSGSAYVPSPARTIPLVGWINTGSACVIPSPMVFPAKTPADVLDFTVDLEAWLEDGGWDIMQAITVTPGTTTPGDVAIGSPLIVSAGLITSWLSFGVPGATYELEYLVATEFGRSLTFTVSVPVLNTLPVPTPPMGPPVPVTWQIINGRLDFRVSRNLIYLPPFV